MTTDRLVRSYVALIPVVDYLYHFPGPAPVERQRICGYFHKAQLFNWFSASTDQLLSGLHAKIVGAGRVFPLEEIKTFFVGYRRDVELTAENVGGSRIRAMILNLVYREKFDASLFESQFSGNAHTSTTSPAGPTHVAGSRGRGDQPPRQLPVRRRQGQHSEACGAPGRTSRG